MIFRKIFPLVLLFFSFLIGNAQEFLQNQDSLKSLSSIWELDSDQKQGTFRLISYKPIYVTAGRWSSNPNGLPQSENPDYSAMVPKDFNNFEAKFQLSFKTKVAQSLFFGHGDLWAGYTQIAHWQIYNTELSRTFRELNYEPELMLNFPMDVKLLGLTLKMAGVTFNHQSNGRDLPRSRSWNRIIFSLGLEAKNLQVYIRPWIRLADEEDENPLITNYIGNGDVTVIYKYKKHAFYAVATNSFSFKDNHGSLQFNYLYPLGDKLKLHAQFFTGYGETLIDYNHFQNTIGIGVSFVNW
ncbi:phospholipase A [Muricauda sp. 334s03]|uniref:Phosphatidylcholine 1-acylhydrolase n=1 Tax=Flagellimonas yonaguniensis TaxID=3031325 RepID=A0ABT5Y1I0_9FLAO|nr:phospholipase A [[Muricauda] yonaguniensis]MDF0717305.1 phospholipase A [[Muricauda] yonaguniensis]